MLRRQGCSKELATIKNSIHNVNKTILIALRRMSHFFRGKTYLTSSDDTGRLSLKDDAPLSISVFYMNERLNTSAFAV